MSVKLYNFQGYDIKYCDVTKQFEAWDGGEMITSSPTQVSLEDKLRKMNKEAFKRIPIMRVTKDWGKGRIEFGEVTSLNRDDHEIWVVFGKRRSKERLSHNSYHEKTDTNIAIANQVVELWQKASALDQEASRLVETMEKPINRLYFGLPERIY